MGRFFFLKCRLGADPEVKPEGYVYLKTSFKRKSLCVASNMPLDVNLEILSYESCSLYHDVPSLKKIEVQREGQTKRVGFIAMEQALFLPHQKR